MENYPDRQSAVEEITGYNRRYNTERPHQTLDGLTPAEFSKQWQDKNNNQNPGKFYLQTVG